ncbi:NAD(P)H-binding protein [Halorubellus sp. JP-L1]|uniref:saccharopine dehydrogenase family protein n=1 Tax=Halorubellus sp. JP-L1 TaxID=2715753 RepID=UPI0014089106|nr:saccharopine dehydrogenase NADP-binding domain-containing protein [Halorubellus sp. JP-L1]NHN42431.1 NAD(P)H-binding protein [Halorubellus sp. JP-L1]
MADDVLIYGSYGYTGELIAKQAAASSDLDPTVAGRNAEKVRSQASRLGLEGAVFSLSGGDDVASEIGDFDVVLNCAGPFSRTAEPMVDACIETGTHYLDITGEWQVFDALAQRSEEAADAGVMLLPGTGFDVVPSDCLAAHLVDRLPDAESITLALGGMGGLSRGTAMTMVEGFGDDGVVRENGELKRVPQAFDDREFEFSHGTRSAMTIPWGDVVTAYHSTGVGNVRVYSETHPDTISRLRTFRKLAPLVQTGPVQSLLKWLVDRRIDGPDDEQLREGSGEIYGEAENAAGERVVSHLETPNAYALTRDTALLCVRRVLDGDAPTGYQTPSTAYGKDLVLEVDGVERIDD